MKIFLAGATGAIGKRLVPLLLEAGLQVIGTTRTPSRAEALRAAGVEPVVVDVFDRASLVRAVTAAHPDVVMQQLTDLPPGLDPSQMVEGTRRNAHMRSEGTRNLVAAALEAGVSRFIAQSIAWMYAAGPEPHLEDDTLDVGAQGQRAITVMGVATLERLVLASPPIEGIVLRYGHLYGPAPEPMHRANPRRCMSMQRLRRRYSRLRRAELVYTTSPSRIPTSPRRKRVASSASRRPIDRQSRLEGTLLADRCP